MKSSSLDKEGRAHNTLVQTTLAGLFVAASILLSGVNFPRGPTKCYPFQHTVNVLAGALLGPWWASGAAFVTSLLRNMMGTGTLFAFPGSIPGAFLAGYAFRLFKKPWAALAEPVGTGLIGAAIASLILGPAMGRSVGLWTLVVAFSASSVPGALLGGVLLHVLRKTPLARYVQSGENGAK